MGESVPPGWALRGISAHQLFEVQTEQEKTSGGRRKKRERRNEKGKGKERERDFSREIGGRRHAIGRLWPRAEIARHVRYLLRGV